MTGYPCELKFTFSLLSISLLHRGVFSVPKFVCRKCLMYYNLFLNLMYGAKRNSHEKRIVRSPERIEIHQEVSEIRRLYYGTLFNK